MVTPRTRVHGDKASASSDFMQLGVCERWQIAGKDTWANAKMGRSLHDRGGRKKLLQRRNIVRSARTGSTEGARDVGGGHNVARIGEGLAWLYYQGN